MLTDFNKKRPPPYQCLDLWCKNGIIWHGKMCIPSLRNICLNPDTPDEKDFPDIPHDVANDAANNMAKCTPTFRRDG